MAAPSAAAAPVFGLVDSDMVTLFVSPVVSLDHSFRYAGIYKKAGTPCDVPAFRSQSWKNGYISRWNPDTASRASWMPQGAVMILVKPCAPAIWVSGEFSAMR